MGRAEKQIKGSGSYFEEKLTALGLSNELLKDQGLDELKDSLEIINDALLNSDAFGKFRMKYSAGFGLIGTSMKSDAHFEVGILPFLLQKKRFVREKIRALNLSKKVNVLKEELEVEADESIQAELSVKISNLEKEVRFVNRKAEEVTEIDIEKTLAAEAKRAEIETKKLERKSKVWQSFLARESVATIVGGFLIFFVTLVLLVAGFFEYQISEVLKNAYLVMLGYFFGQNVQAKAKRRPGKLKSKRSKTTGDKLAKS